MSTEYTVPSTPANTEPELPMFNNGITPPKPEPIPELTEFPPRVPITDDYTVPTDLVYRPPVEAVQGVGGIPGVQAEE